MSGVINWITPVSVKPSTSAAWTSFDLQNSIPVNAAVVIIDVSCTNNSPRIGVRANNSTDATLQYLNTSGSSAPGKATLYVGVNLDGTRIIQTYTSYIPYTSTFQVIGYMLQGVARATQNRQQLSPTTGLWADWNISSLVGSDAPIAALVHVENTGGGGYNLGFRPKGSTDNRVSIISANSLTSKIIPVDSNKIFQYNTSSSNVRIYLVGWILKGLVCNTNYTDMGGNPDNNYNDLMALPIGALEVFVDAIQTGAVTNFGLRKKGSIDADLKQIAGQYTASYPIECDDSQLIQGNKQGSSTLTFWQIGYSVPVPTQSTDLQCLYCGGVNNTNPNNSLGGALSTTQNGVIKTSTFDNLFADVSVDEAVSGSSKYRCFYFKNNHPSTTYQNAKIWIQQLTLSTDDEFSIGLGTAGLNGTEQTIADENTAPAGVVFSQPTSEQAALSIGNIPAGQVYPIWVKRVVNPQAQIYSNNSGILRIQGES